jgi:hypothetical protein
MDLKPLAVFLHNPSASSIQAGLEADEYSIGGVLPFFSTQVTSCDIACATPCLPQQWSIQFDDVDFGTCNDCGLSVAFVMKLRRQSNFDIEDYLHLTSDIELVYEPDDVPSGLVTAQTIRDYFLNFLDGSAVYDDEHDFFGVTAVASGTDTLILTVPCPVQLDIFKAQDAVGFVITAGVVQILETPGQTASLTQPQLLKEYPLMIGYVPGQAPDDTFTQCEDICLIEIKGCIPTCVSDANNLLTTVNAVHLHEVGTKFHYKLFVNSSGPGYTAFITALNAAVAACPATPTFGSQIAAVQDPAGATLDLTAIGADGSTATGEFTGYTSAEGTISDGEVTVYFSVTGAPVTADAINTAINTAIGSANLQANGVITLVGVPFNGDATIIKVDLKA